MDIIKFLISALDPVVYRFQYSRNSWHILSDLQSYCKSKTSVSESSILFCESTLSGNLWTCEQNTTQLNSVHCMLWLIKKTKSNNKQKKKEVLVRKDSLVLQVIFLMDF